jgi:hypothetical protein
MRRKAAVLAFVLVLGALMAGAALAQGKSGPVTGKVAGYFHRNCLTCGGPDKYIAASNVWCGWQDGHVVIHVTFHNRSVEGLKVTWHPSYTIRMGSDHGGGLTSLQDVKLAGGQTKSVLVGQNPKDTPTSSAIGVCKPSFYLVGH